MNLRRRYCILAASAIITLTGFNSCKKNYSSDDPLPDIYSQTLFVSSNNQIVYALDPISGKTKWKFPVDGEVDATPMLYNKTLYVGTAAGTLYALNPQHGTQIQTRSFGAPIIGTPIMRGDILVVVAGNFIHTLNAQTLDDYYLPTVNISSLDLGGQIMSSPTIHNIAGGKSNAIFVSTMGNKVVALDEKLQILWTFAPTTTGAFYSSPCVVNDSFLYVGNDDGNMYAVKTVDGTQKWNFSTGGQVRSSPIQIGGNVLFGSNDRNFYSVDSAKGLLRWKVTTGDVIQSSPAVFDQNVYFGSYDANLYCVDIIDGKVKWKQLTAALIKSSPLIYRGDVYFGGYDKLLYRLNAEDGSQRINPVSINGQMATSPIIDSVNGAAVPSISGNYKY